MHEFPNVLFFFFFYKKVDTKIEAHFYFVIAKLQLLVPVEEKYALALFLIHLLTKFGNKDIKSV